MKRVLLAASTTSQHRYLRQQFTLRSSSRTVPCRQTVSRTPIPGLHHCGSRMWLSSESKSQVEPPKDPQDESTPPESRPDSETVTKFTVPVEIRMPDMSAGHQNTVETWFKQPGDVIKYNDVLCDIATQDFTFGLSMDDDHDAIMGEIHVEAGTKVPDGTPICTVYHPEGSP